MAHSDFRALLAQIPRDARLAVRAEEVGTNNSALTLQPLQTFFLLFAYLH